MAVCLERQPSLFQRRRSKGRKPSEPSEFAVQCAVADVCHRWCNPGWRWTHLPFGEHRSPATGGRLKRMGTHRGWPDFVFVGYEQRIVWLELKRRGGKLSPEQQDIAAHLSACGFVHVVAEGFNEAVELLKGYGVLRSVIGTGGES